MVIKEKTVKERIIEQLDRMDEAELATLEERLKEARIERQVAALRGIAGILSNPEEYAEFEKHARRRSLFGGRTLDLEPDEET